MDEKSTLDRYFVKCPIRETGEKIPVTICERCDFRLTYEDGKKVLCNFPSRRRKR